MIRMSDVIHARMSDGRDDRRVPRSTNTAPYYLGNNGRRASRQFIAPVNLLFAPLYNMTVGDFSILDAVQDGVVDGKS
jgi:hypothetical protein